jgi:hypothetical protein
VHEDLTVRENLAYSARLRQPPQTDRMRRKDIVRDALEMLGLAAIQHYRVRAGPAAPRLCLSAVPEGVGAPPTGWGASRLLG